MNLKHAAIAASLACAATQAHALDKVTFGTNWLPEAEHGGFYEAVADGTYAKCGLDVTIVPGGPQVNNQAMLMAGKLTFNMVGNLLIPFNAVEQGIPVKVVAAEFQKDPQILMTHPGRVKTFAEVATLPKQIIGGNAFESFYKWLITAYGFKASDRVPYTFNPAPFIADVNSAQQGYVTSEPYAVEQQGKFKPDVWLLADHGWKTPSTLTEAMQSTIDQHPDWVKCFNDASAIGWTNYLYGDPTPANKMILAANSEMDQKQLDFSRNQLIKYGIVDSGYSLTHGIGALDPATVKAFYDDMVKSGVMKAGLDVTKSYTTEFTNNGASLAVKKKLTGQ